MDRFAAPRQEIAELLVRTGQAHHEAFRATDGEDPDWPIWYADHLREPLGRLLQTSFTRSQLVYCLMNAEFERGARAEDAEWSGFYADHFVERFAPSESPRKDELILYHFPSCPFCARVRSAIDRLGLAVELRDIRADAEHWNALVAARGRATVPVLRIVSPDGSERWMPESGDIVRYLDKTYG